MLKRLFVIIFLLLSVLVHSQVRVVSPLTNGILQVREDRGLLHFQAAVPPYAQHFSITLSSDTSTEDPYAARQPIAVTNGWIDTVISVPKSLRFYTLWWFADSAGQPMLGFISGLTPGHIVAIAGQSNAQGATWNMLEAPDHDVRMLRDEHAWEAAHEPTGNFSGGPWIAMANVLDSSIRDSLPIGIVNAAWGGTGLISNSGGGLWTRNAARPDDSSIYGNALRRFRCAGGLFECLCWIQGESEGFDGFPSIQMYKDSFVTLVKNFRSDLGDTCPFFHLQVDGLNTPGSGLTSWMQVREAHRTLPISTLVGTSIGRPEVDLHYTPETHRAVGGMFAGALLWTQYHIASPMYPPLMPDSTATVDSVSDPGLNKYCFRIRWSRGGQRVKLLASNTNQYFALQRGGEFLDTSKVWSRIAQDSQSVLVGLRSDVIDLSKNWTVAYCAAADGDDAPLATRTATGDTIFATAFFGLPTVLPQAADVNASAPIESSATTVSLYDELGRLLFAALVRDGEQFDLSRANVPSGCYWLRTMGTKGAAKTTKVIIIR